ncbi:MAG: ATP-binding cassette domain-containing protein [Bacteroidetes bacterium]|nr:MAG: ATP-binding cassette domain-containing protein [Bacteroidota bacterium]MBL1145532.1 ATP-binding cassette domain-containing protein [Bacteroidota bacterium]NOG58329.1 ATP-binding cassette domain-containing protein [Bacteroidota bacterium]
MHIQLAEIGKKFNREWIFKDVNFTFKENSVTAILGSNGSGKSTLLKIISAAELPSSGIISYTNSTNKLVDLNEVYQYISFVGPYMDLPELLTLDEVFKFHNQFRPINMELEEFAKTVYLENDRQKQIKNYSSGMRQRLKLGLSILSQSPILFLDEPCSNLDHMGIDLYQRLLKNNADNRIILIGSNDDKNEIFMATQTIDIMNYK